MRIYKEDLDLIRNKYPSDILELDLKILYLRTEGEPYKTIQLVLGNPSKKYIRSVLLKYNSSLIDKDCNYNKL